MSRATRRAAFGVAVLLLLLTASTRAQGSRAFIVALQGNANPVPTEDPCVLVNTETATGWSPGIGALVWESREEVNLCAGPDGADIQGEFTITVANGDRLSGTYRTLGQLDIATNRISARGRYRIAAGTGAFAGASSEGLLGAEGSLLPPFEFTGVLFGNISF
jgi:hypothetical protein